MKYKNKLSWLKMKQNWYDKLPQSVKNALTRPGSVNTR